MRWLCCLLLLISCRCSYADWPTLAGLDAVPGEKEFFQSEFLADGRHGWVAARIGAAGRTVDTVLRTTDGGATWQRSIVGTGCEFSALEFVDADHGWAAAEDMIIRTEDGGATWAAETIEGDDPQILDLSMVNATVGFAAGGSGPSAALFSYNGSGVWRTHQLTPWYGQYAAVHARGRAWLVASGGGIVHGETPDISSFGLGWPISDLHFSDANRGWAGGRMGLLYTTSDGGRAWTRRELPIAADVLRVHLSGSGTGGVLTADGQLLTTSDNGASWEFQRVSREAVDLDFNGSYYIVTTSDSLRTPAPRVLIPGALPRMRRVGGEEPERSPAAGKPRFARLQSFPLTDPRGRISTGHFQADGSRAWAITQVTLPQTMHYIERGDRNWRTSTFPPGAYTVLDIHSRGGTAALMGGSGSATTARISSTEDGWNWGPDAMEGGWETAPGIVVRVFDSSERRGWALIRYGPKSDLYTCGPDRQWIQTRSNFATSAKALFGVGDQMVWAGADTTDAVRTTGPLSFERMDFPVRGTIGDFFFIDGNRGWCGVGKNVLRTADGGRTWELLPQPYASANVTSLHFIDQRQGVVLYDTGVTMETKDGGDSWGVMVDAAGAASLSIGNPQRVFRYGSDWVLVAQSGIYTTMPQIPAQALTPLQRMNRRPELGYPRAALPSDSSFDHGRRPSSGGQGSLVEFRVRYSDPDGDPPREVTVELTDARGERHRHTMRPYAFDATNYQTGVNYGVCVPIGRSGEWGYYFVATDAAGLDSTRLPGGSWIAAPRE